MFAFAGHFLLEVSTKYTDQLSLNREIIFGLIENMISLFHMTPCIAQHPIHRMAEGLGGKLRACREGSRGAGNGLSQVVSLSQNGSTAGDMIVVEGGDGNRYKSDSMDLAQGVDFQGNDFSGQPMISGDSQLNLSSASDSDFTFGYLQDFWDIGYDMEFPVR